ncbi:MAG: FAD-dependent oxidoreductase [Acidimicrobiales bacterium]
MGVRGTFDRTWALTRLAADRFDVLVIGGGVTGSGVALDAAARGLRVAMVEKDDFSSGTSSRSSKLIHGGLRYLQNGDVRLVYEALAERSRLQRNAPHLVRVLPFLIPLYAKEGAVNRKLTRAFGSALWMYDLTGGLRIGKRHQRLSTEEALGYMPTLPADRLTGAYLYFDAQADDARLTITIARTAALDFGATVANRVRVIGLTKDREGRVSGARAVDTELGHELTIGASVVVNATGVWADDVRALDDQHPSVIRPGKGVHLTLPWDKVRNTIAAVVPVPGERRSVFVVPWDRFTYVGTTDTDYDGPLDDPTCTPDDVAYLLGALNEAITTEVTDADVLATWAGLRPLVRDASSGRTADLSRRHLVRRAPSGLITVTGGKLTTYREMAEDTVDEAVELLEGLGFFSAIDRSLHHSRTRRLPLRGAGGYDDLVAEAEAAGADERLLHLANRYGGEARTIVAMTEHDPALAEPLVPGLPYLKAEAVYGVRYEMARSVDDVLSRRTRARILARDASAAAAADVAALIGPELEWAADDQAREANAYRAAVARERADAGLPEPAAEPSRGA